MAKWYEGGGHVVDFPLHLTNQQFTAGLEKLREVGWTDRRTRLGACLDDLRELYMHGCARVWVGACSMPAEALGTLQCFSTT